MIMDKNKTLEFTLEGLIPPETDDDQCEEFKEYERNYDEVVGEINHFLQGALTFAFRDVNFQTGNFTLSFVGNEVVSGLEDDELGMYINSYEKDVALVIVKVNTKFTLTEKPGRFVILEEK